VSRSYLSQSPVADLVFNLSVAAFGVGEVFQAFRIRRGASRADLRAEAVFRAIFFAGLLALPAGRALVPSATYGGLWLFALGLAVGWFGLLVRWWSFVTLGRYFTVVVRTSGDQPVIDRGPYRVLRHPSYTGLLLAVTGCGLMLGTLVGTPAAIVLTLIALVYRIRKEEAALTAALGDPYRRFAASRARLIPYVW
jgi:protein-S-isoprenylcysteine O-methyltransferase Ste14